MKIIKFNEFEDGYILKEYENDGNYDVIGCFKEPDFYTIVGNSDFFINYFLWFSLKIFL